MNVLARKNKGQSKADKKTNQKKTFLSGSFGLFGSPINNAYSVTHWFQNFLDGLIMGYTSVRQAL